MTESASSMLIELTADIVSAHVSNNVVGNGDVPDLIRSVHDALSHIASGGSKTAEPAAVEKPAAAVGVRKSTANPEHILSMIDGKPYKSLKRHISGHGYTPESYREAFGLPANYPMVAAAYSERRRAVAKRLGLGRKKADAPAAVTPAPAPTAPRKRTVKAKAPAEA